MPLQTSFRPNPASPDDLGSSVCRRQEVEVAFFSSLKKYFSIREDILPGAPRKPPQEGDVTIFELRLRDGQGLSAAEVSGFRQALCDVTLEDGDTVALLERIALLEADLESIEPDPGAGSNDSAAPGAGGGSGLGPGWGARAE